MLSLIAVLIPVIYLFSRVPALENTHTCVGDTNGILPTPTPYTLLTNEQFARSTRMLAAIDITERHSVSNSTAGRVWDFGLEQDAGGGNLLMRQSRCENPGWIPICPGPRPCCPPSNTVCCLSQGICCLNGHTCGPTGTRACCLPGGSFCATGKCCCDPGKRCCTQGVPGCCSGSCCGVGCCATGFTCCGGEHCCDSGSTCCGSSCCPTGTTCCGGSECCVSGEICDTVTNQCYDPYLSSLSAASASAARSASLAALSSAAAAATVTHGPSDSNPGEEGPEVTLEPSDPQIQYDPPDAWSSTGGSCTNGTRTTIQIGAKITFEFDGNEVSVSFVPHQDNVTVSVEVNGLPFEEFEVPGQSSTPQCQLPNSWNGTLAPSTSAQQVSFIYKGPGGSTSKRATPALELGEIRYLKSVQASTSSNDGVRLNSKSALMLGAVILVLLVS